MGIDETRLKDEGVDVLLDFSDDGNGSRAFAYPFPIMDAEPLGDSADTPPVDTFRELERDCVREERWEDLAVLLVERAGSTRDPTASARHLVRAAQVFETKLSDADRAFVALLAALKELPSNDEVARELARLATVHDRWQELLARCEILLGEINSQSQRADLLVTMACWYERDQGDPVEAEKSLEAAMSADPTNYTALRSLVLLHGQRGDWHRAAAYLTCAAGNAVDPFDSVEFALDAAEIYRDQLHDMEGAVEQYTRVLEMSPGHPKAVAALAEAAWQREDWSAATSLLEDMAGSAKLAMEETASLWQKAAWSAQMTGEMERARGGYRRAFGVLPTHLPTLQSWSQLAGEQGWWQDVLTTVPRLLAQAGDRMTPVERATHLMRLGRAHMALRDSAAGTAAFTEALHFAPDLPGAREALVEATAKMEGRGPANAAALVEQYRTLLHSTQSNDERFDIICKIGRLQREELNDQPAALGTFLQAAQLRPDDVGVLHELVEIHTANRHWSRAVDMLERLVRLTVGREKACYLATLASILHRELDAPDEAVALYDQALDEDPTDRRTFERIEHMLVERQDWRELARAYRRMIKRLGASPSPESRVWLLAVWRALADTCRQHLLDIQAAVAAYEVCVSLAPDDPRQREALAEACESQGQEGFSQAVAAREHLLAAAGNAEAAVRQIRALAHLYSKYGQHDRAFCACAGLCALTKANAHERAYYERGASAGVPVSRTFLTEKLWQGRICPARENRLISQVMAAVAPGVITARAKEAASHGIDIHRYIDPDTDPSFVSRLLVYVSRLIGVPLPAIYAPPGAPGEIDLVILLNDTRPVPAFVLGRDLVAGRTQQELAFLLTKKIVGLRADHFLLWPQLVPTLSELRVIFAAAIKLVQPKFDLPDVDPAAVRKYLSFLHRVLPSSQVALIAAAVGPVFDGTANLDLAAWAAVSDEVANRAGLLACGDIVASAREIVREARAFRRRPEEAILDLVRWGTSSDYLDLRADLGVALVQDEARTPPIARSFSDLGRLIDRGIPSR
jgi:tetratricopeptide (TPR) repeat protein